LWQQHVNFRIGDIKVVAHVVLSSALHTDS
jgi:hypothetical protein